MSDNSGGGGESSRSSDDPPLQDPTTIPKPAAAAASDHPDRYLTRVIQHMPFVTPLHKLPPQVQDQERQLRLQQSQDQRQSFLAELQALEKDFEDDDDSVSSLTGANEDLMSAVQDDPDLYDSYVTGRIDFDQLAETVRRRYLTPAGEDPEDDDENDVHNDTAVASRGGRIGGADSGSDDDGEDLVRELLSGESPPQKRPPPPKQPQQPRPRASPMKRPHPPTAASPAKSPAKRQRRTATTTVSDGGAAGGGGPAFVSFLDESLRGLVGQASLQLAKGDAPGAIRICEEVMKIQPRSHEVYETLHEAYEKLGQGEKAAQFLLVAAHLHRSDPSKWCRLAEFSRAAGKFKEAAQYLTSAIRIGGPDSEMLRVERAELYKLAGDTSSYLRAYLDVLKRMEMEPGQALELARELANGFYQQEDFDRAAACYEAAFQRFPELLTDAEVNIAIDLLFKGSGSDRFARALHLFVSHYGVAMVTSASSVGGEERRLTCGAGLAEVEAALRCGPDGRGPPLLRVDVPEALVTELLVKLAMSLASAGCQRCFVDDASSGGLMPRLLALSPAENCDLLLDVADAMAHSGMRPEARRLLEGLLLKPGSGCDDKAAVWLSYAQCLRDMGLRAECVAAYERTIQLAPDYHQARLALSDVQVSLGQSAEALETLRVPELDGDSASASSGGGGALATADSARLALNRCLMLLNRDPAAFQTEAWRLLFGRLEPLLTQLGCGTMQGLLAAFTRGRKSDSLLDKVNKAFGGGRSGHLSPDDLWDVYRQLVQRLHEAREWERLDLATSWAIYHPAFSGNRRRCEQINLLALTSSFYTRSLTSVLTLAKDFCVRYQRCNVAPNTLALVAGLAQCTDRVALRMATKHPGLQYPLLLLGAQGFLLTGKYRRALLTLTHLRRLRRDDPMVPLLAAVAFASMACQRQVANRHFFAAHASALLACYGQMRGDCQEVAYNTARCLHRLGLSRHAAAGYERALAIPPEGATPEQRRRNDLSLPAAHNLLVLYKAAGNQAMVNALLQRHLVID